jgi:extracellular factor (EF) 3-hydroxypalmitic acid methyl ester biosynthesis protein
MAVRNSQPDSNACTDPVTSGGPLYGKGYRKLRGYAGDAVMLDCVYEGQFVDYTHDSIVSHLGKIVFQETVGSLSGEAVRNRKQILAEYVDAIAEEVHQPVILAIAYGHLCETSTSHRGLLLILAF